MKILIGIIAFHLLVIARSKASKKEDTPYLSTLFFTVAMVVYVVFMLHLMEEPIP